MGVGREGLSEAQASKEKFKAWATVIFNNAAERTKSPKSVDQRSHSNHVLSIGQWGPQPIHWLKGDR